MPQIPIFEVEVLEESPSQEWAVPDELRFGEDAGQIVLESELREIEEAIYEAQSQSRQRENLLLIEDELLRESAEAEYIRRMEERFRQIERSIERLDNDVLEQQIRENSRIVEDSFEQSLEMSSRIERQLNRYNDAFRRLEDYQNFQEANRNLGGEWVSYEDFLKGFDGLWDIPEDNLSETPQQTSNRVNRRWDLVPESTTKVGGDWADGLRGFKLGEKIREAVSRYGDNFSGLRREVAKILKPLATGLEAAGIAFDVFEIVKNIVNYQDIGNLFDILGTLGDLASSLQSLRTGTPSAPLWGLTNLIFDLTTGYDLTEMLRTPYIECYNNGGSFFISAIEYYGNGLQCPQGEQCWDGSFGICRDPNIPVPGPSTEQPPEPRFPPGWGDIFEEMEIPEDILEIIEREIDLPPIKTPGGLWNPDDPLNPPAPSLPNGIYGVWGQTGFSFAVRIHRTNGREGGSLATPSPPYYSETITIDGTQRYVRGTSESYSSEVGSYYNMRTGYGIAWSTDGGFVPYSSGMGFGITTRIDSEGLLQIEFGGSSHHYYPQEIQPVPIPPSQPERPPGGDEGEEKRDKDRPVPAPPIPTRRKRKKRRMKCCPCSSIQAMVNNAVKQVFKEYEGVLIALEAKKFQQDRAIKFNPDAYINQRVRVAYNENSYLPQSVDARSLLEYNAYIAGTNFFRSGLHDLPGRVPQFVTDDGGGEVTQSIYTQLQFLEWIFYQIDALVGSFPVKIKVKDGSGEADFKLENVSEAVAEILGILFQVAADADAASNIALRATLEGLKAQTAATQNQSYLKALFEALGVRTTAIPLEIKASINPSKISESGDEIAVKDVLQFCRQYAWGIKYAERDELIGILQRILFNSEIVRSVFYRDLKSNSSFTGDYIREAKKAAENATDPNVQRAWEDIEKDYKDGLLGKDAFGTEAEVRSRRKPGKDDDG